MATSKRCSDEVDDEDQADECAICQDDFKAPKILPCFHSFCEQCLKDLTEDSPDMFPCPCCRKQTEVPNGGVSDFQSNFYIKPKAKRKKPSTTANATSVSKPCVKHPSEELEFFCEDCYRPICFSCRLRDCFGHKTKDLNAYTAAAKDHLLKEGERLKGQIECARRSADLAARELKATEGKQLALRKFIEDRHRLLQEHIDLYRNVALNSLDEVSKEILSGQEKEVQFWLEKTENIRRLLNRVQRAVDSESIDEVLNVDTQVRESNLDQDSVHTELTTGPSTVYRPVLHVTSNERPTDAVRKYMNLTAIRMELPVVASEVVLQELFRFKPWLGHDDIWHLCPMTDDTVWVSYKWCQLNGNFFCENSEKLRFDGKRDDSQSNICCEKTARMGIGGGRCLEIKPPAGTRFVFAKRRDSNLTRFLGLRSNLTGQVAVEEIRVESVEPLITVPRDLGVINSSCPRSCDVDPNEQFLVVVDEANSLGDQRTVKLYEPPQADPIITYKPHLNRFQPSDACFYTLGGQLVLLVADELNDAIHVVQLHDGELHLAGYLAPGCPNLIKPTALNKDAEGRLLVACAGGSVLRSHIK